MLDFLDGVTAPVGTGQGRRLNQSSDMSELANSSSMRRRPTNHRPISRNSIAKPTDEPMSCVDLLAARASVAAVKALPPVSSAIVLERLAVDVDRPG